MSAVPRRASLSCFLAQLRSLKLFPAPRAVICGDKAQFLHIWQQWFPVLLRLDIILTLKCRLFKYVDPCGQWDITVAFMTVIKLSSKDLPGRGSTLWNL